MTANNRKGVVLRACTGILALTALAVPTTLMQSSCPLIPAPPTTSPEALVANAGTDKTVTVGQLVILAGSATGGNSPYSFQWLQTDGPALTIVPATGDTASISVSAAGTGVATLELTVTDANGTQDTDTVTVTVNSAATTFAVTATATPSSLVLPDNTFLSANPTGGVPGYTYNWLQTSGPQTTDFLDGADAQTTEVDFNDVGTYTFTVTVTDANGTFVTSDPVTVTVTADESLEFTNDPEDDLMGSAGDDLFTADAGDVQTTDRADGLDGNDTVLFKSAFAAAPFLANIERVRFSVAGATTLNAGNSSGITSVESIDSTAGVTVNSLDALVDAAITGGDGGANLTLGFAAAAVTGATDTINLTLFAAAGGTFTANDVEIFNVSSGGTDNSVNLAGDSLVTVNVTGDMDLDLSGAALPNTVDTLDASALTGDLTVVTGDNDMTITTGSGDDDVTLGNGDMTVNTGAGDDAVTIAAGHFTATDTIDGGADDDELSIGQADAVAVTTAGDALTNVSNIEQLTLTGAVAGNVNVTLFGSGITTLNLPAAVTGDQTITVSSGLSVTIGADSATGDDDVTFTRSGTGTTDSLSVTLEEDPAVNGVVISGDTIFSGIETVNIVSNGEAGDTNVLDDAVTITPSAGVASGTINVTGDTDLDLGAAITAGVINASAFTGNLTATVVAGSTVTITGGSGDDTLGGSDNNDSVSGGAGDDVIDGNDGNDALAGGAGEDTFVFAAGDLAGAPSATNNDTISDFEEGVDIIDFGAALTIVSGADTPAAGEAEINAEGIASFHADDDTLAERITAVEAAINDNAVAAAGQFAVFEFDGDSYIFISEGTDGVDAGDVLIVLSGVTGLSNTTIDGGGDLTIE